MSSPPRTEGESATGLTPSEQRHVRLVVCDHAADPDDARRLLEMLGLVEPPTDELLGGGA